MGVDPSHLSRVENGHTESLGETADRLARAIAVIARDGDAARDVLLRMADDVGKEALPERPGKKAQTPVYKMEKKRWLRVA